MDSAFLTIEAVDEDSGEASLQAWRTIHNAIIPTDPLSFADVVERSKRNRMHVGYLGKLAVACSTIRPPVTWAQPFGLTRSPLDRASDDEVMVIVRVLPAFRRTGLGSQLYAYLLREPWVTSTKNLTTVVLAANDSGLQFALNRGFTQVDEYEIGGATYVDLRLDRVANGVSPKGRA
jgi:GNAT superfamily N-acetyltransferase